MHSFLHVFSGGSSLWGCDHHLAPFQCDTREEGWLCCCDVKVFKMSPHLCQNAAQATSCADYKTCSPKLEVWMESR